jgi:hypothetical protein
MVRFDASKLTLGVRAANLPLRLGVLNFGT